MKPTVTGAATTVGDEMAAIFEGAVDDISDGRPDGRPERLEPARRSGRAEDRNTADSEQEV